MRFELLWGYCHCFGKTTYHAGFAASEAEARRWVQTQPCGMVMREIPVSEPLRRCPVVSCPGKRQRPWFGFRAVTQTGGGSP
jgi:hypothetical protein